LGVKAGASMNSWIFRLGAALIVIGLLLLSPFGDLLPVNFWFRLDGLLGINPPPSEHIYYRVVPGGPNRTLELVLIGVGAFLAIGARLRRDRK
jgi:hypothetical protein